MSVRCRCRNHTILVCWWCAAALAFYFCPTTSHAYDLTPRFIIRQRMPVVPSYSRCMVRCLLQARCIEGVAKPCTSLASDTSNAHHPEVILIRECNVTSPRQWLESHDDGVYTVLRCGYFHNSSALSALGQDFHLERLCRSYSMFTHSKGVSTSKMEIDAAKETSLALMQMLLHDAAKTAEPTPIFIMTILWFWPSNCYSDPSDTVPAIQITGHIAPVSTVISPQPKPIRLSLAYHPTIASESLPSRFPFPQAKLSSWCRERRLLEELFQPDGVQEVVLCRIVSTESKIQLLEGLTSNLFVHYRDGTLRTAEPNNVLSGFARSLVVQHAQQLGINVEEKAPTLDECHLWEEVFVTSSIRLIVPVNEIVMIQPQSSSSSSSATETAVWSFHNKQQVGKKQIWSRLYDSIHQSLGVS